MRLLGTTGFTICLLLYFIDSYVQAFVSQTSIWSIMIVVTWERCPFLGCFIQPSLVTCALYFIKPAGTLEHQRECLANPIKQKWKYDHPFWHMHIPSVLSIPCSHSLSITHSSLYHPQPPVITLIFVLPLSLEPWIHLPTKQPHYYNRGHRQHNGNFAGRWIQALDPSSLKIASPECVLE